MTPKVSVIIPVYNTAPYLRRCLDSVTRQTLRNIEIICVDDGSTDGSADILREYAARDSRIKLISLPENTGASVARNVGIAKARGKYIGFVDSDDTIEPGFYEKLYTNAAATQADVIKGEIIVDGQLITNEAVRRSRGYFYYFFTSAIYKRTFLLENKINFPSDLYAGEDPIFSMRIALATQDFEFVDEARYNYQHRPDSCSQLSRLTVDKLEKRIAGYRRFLDILDASGADEEWLLAGYCGYVQNELAIIVQDAEQDIEATVSSFISELFTRCVNQEEFMRHWNLMLPSLLPKLKRSLNAHAPLISVIIPVYNVEPYLARCLDSVLGQTFEGLELICVEDKSSDNSAVILKEYAEKDVRITILRHDKNRGLSAARNTGIAAARGKYIYFIDSDDWIAVDYLQKMLTAIETSGADIVRNINVIEHFGDTKKEYSIHPISKDGVYDCTDFKLYYAWTYMFKKMFLDAHPMFPEGLRYEDNYMYFITVRKLEAMYLFSGPPYHYYRRTDSITGPTRKVDNSDIIEINRLIWQDYKENGLLGRWGVPIDKTFCRSHLENNIRPIDFFENLKIFFKEIEPDVRSHTELYNSVEIDFFNRVLKSANYARYLLSKHRKGGDYVIHKIRSELDFTAPMDKINVSDIVSFDIFDTLLLRPFVQPIDLFFYIEIQTGEFGFGAERVRAERAARQKKTMGATDAGEITFDEIYAEINEVYAHLKQVELDLEETTLRPNPKVLELFKYAISQGKRVIVTSDMYLSRTFIERILEKNGFVGYEKLYLSSDINKTKASGSLYKHIASDLGIEMHKILHIGDNFESDVIAGRRLGISTYWSKKTIDRFQEVPAHAWVKRYLRTKRDIRGRVTASVTFGLLAIKWNALDGKEDFWRRFGYTLGGPLAYGFTKAVAKIAEARGLSDILFIARDGYILNEIYPFIKGNCKAQGHYVYASRKLRYCCTGQVGNAQELYHFLMSNDVPGVSSDIASNRQIYIDNIENLQPYIEENAHEYSEYINSIPLSGSVVGIVDTIAERFSAQTLIETFLKEARVYGIYLNTKPHLLQYDYIALNNYTNENDFGWNIIELLLASVEYPVEGIRNGLPVYTDNSDVNEDARREAIAGILEGEREFIRDLLEIFDNLLIEFDIRSIFAIISSFMHKPDDESAAHLSRLCASSEVGKPLWKPLLPIPTK